jgi:hypothetical protein
MEPQILELPSQTMATVRSKGDPNDTSPTVMSAFFSAVYTVKFELKKKGISMTVRHLRARWPDAHILPKNQWTAIWGIPIPDDIKSLPQKDPNVKVEVEHWEYGTVAQVVHLGPYSTEGDTIQRLHAFITDSGYEIAGHHEEEYLTRPTAKVLKTIIRYQIRKKK